MRGPVFSVAGTLGWGPGRALHGSQYPLSRKGGRGNFLRTLLVWQAALRVWALGIALSSVHRTIAPVLLRTIHMLRWSVLSGCLTGGGLIPDRRQLRSTHLGRHHVMLILAGLTRSLRSIVAGPGGFLALAFVFGLALVLFLLLLGFPFFADFFELYERMLGQQTVVITSKLIRANEMFGDF